MQKKIEAFVWTQISFMSQQEATLLLVWYLLLDFPKYIKLASYLSFLF